MKLQNALGKAGLLAAVLSLAAVWLIVAAYFCLAIPLSDDYGRATTQSFPEAIARTAFTYQSWSGRWAGMFVQFSIWGVFFRHGEHFFEVYRVALAVLGVISFCSVVWIMKYAVDGGWWRRLVGGTAFAATYLAVYHSPGETLYWLPGATEAGLAAVSAAVVVWIAIGTFFGQQSERRLGAFVGVCILGVLSSGFHELGGLFLCGFFALSLLAGRMFRCEGNRGYLFAALLVLTAATAFSVFAPGNSVRARHSLPEAVSSAMALHSFAQIWIRVLRVLLSPPLLLGVLLVVVWDKQRGILRHTLAPRLEVVLAACAFASLVVVAAIVAMKSGHNPAARTVNFFVTTAVLTALPLLVLFVARKARAVEWEVPRPVWAGLCFLFALAVMTGSTLDRGLFSYKTQLLPWMKYHKAKHAYLRQDHGDNEVLLAPSPPHPPMLAAWSDTTENPDTWLNRTQAAFYGVKAVRVERRKVTYESRDSPGDRGLGD